MRSVSLINQITRMRSRSCPVSPISCCCHVLQKATSKTIQETRKNMSVTATTTAPAGTTGKSHLERTGDKPRDPDLHKVTVSQISAISPSVKKVVLSSAVSPVPFSFKAGQWVDLFVPGISKIGGFTITSSPEELRTTGSFHLAIQESIDRQEPALWVHTECRVNDQVSIRVGGDFFFDPEHEEAFTGGLLLLAGGVGINPLSSIIKEIHARTRRIPTVLLFSAKTQEELIFKEEFESIMKQDKNFVCKFFLTGPAVVDMIGSGFGKGRIGLEDIQGAINTLSTIGAEQDKVKVYICGPPPMIEKMEEMTTELKLMNVATEKWW